MNKTYENALAARYSGKEMQYIFSPDNKFKTWRKLWAALAESQRQLGLDITEEQIAELKSHIDDIDYKRAGEYETRLRHDVMAHIKAYGDVCPKAKGIIHLGATSAYVGDNTDIILMRDALKHIRKLVINCVAALYEFAKTHANLPTLSYTHFQPAQPTTVGKRASLWIQDLLFDLERLDFEIANLKLLGCKGTTGTSASFLALFGGDHEKVKRLEELIAQKIGFEGCYNVSGQTYSRKIDYNILSALSMIAQSASKFANDIRLLSHLREFEEPFEDGQVGSSAMAYKRNPMRSERICSLSRFVMTLSANPAITAASQWFERTLDDSANKRIVVPEAFLAVDGILSLYINVSRGVRVYPKVISRHLREELPFMATENILMRAVASGGDRQSLHEKIRLHSIAAKERIKLYGEDNDLIKRIALDKTFGLTEEELLKAADADALTGRAGEQTEEYLRDIVYPVIKANEELLGGDFTISV
ncbi:MAG: adenylosuccinate lyase [Eubacteriales bacterium]